MDSWLDRVRHFSASDGGLHDPHGTLIDVRLMELLDQAREEAGVPFIVTSGFRLPAQNAAAGGAADSAHLADKRGVGCAVDGFFDGWPILEQFVHLTRFPFFAVGAYPYPPPGRDPSKRWTPVVHADRKDRRKPFNAKVLWIRNAAGDYVYWPSAEFNTELRAIARVEGA